MTDQLMPPTAVDPTPAPPPVKLLWQPGFWTTPGGIAAILGIALMAVVAIGVGVAVFGGSKVTAVMTSCEFNGSTTLPIGRVGYDVTNSGKTTRTVRLKIEYRDSSGARVDTDTATVRNIAPGDTVRGQETTLLNAPVPSGDCMIVNVS